MRKNQQCQGFQQKKKIKNKNFTQKLHSSLEQTTSKTYIEGKVKKNNYNNFFFLN